MPNSKNIFYIILIVNILTSCTSIKNITFSGGEWEIYPNAEVVRNEQNGNTFVLNGMFEVCRLNSNCQIINNQQSLPKNKNLAKYAKSVFDDLKITSKDTVLFFVPGRIIVYLPQNFDVAKSDYIFSQKQEDTTKFIREGSGSFSEIRNDCFYRKIIFNKKYKRVINIDTFKDKQNRWLSMVYLHETETKYNNKISPRIWTSMSEYVDFSIFEHLLNITEVINSTDKITIENFLKIRQ